MKKLYLKRIKLRTYILLIFFIALSVKAQKHELGKVTIDELKEKVCPRDTSAVAAILFKKGFTRFDLDPEGHFSLYTEINYKIKIYKKEGLKYSNQKGEYYVGGNNDEVVFFSNACTYNLVDDKIVKTKLKSESEFKESVNENWKERKITLPAVKEGSIIEFTYILKSPYLSNLNDWYFQSEIPINYVEYSVTIPKYFEYRTVITGYQKIELKSEPVLSSRHGEVEHTYTKSNVPALVEEDYVNNIKNYTSILKFELASIEYPNRSKENIALDWEGAVKKIYDNENFGQQLKKNSYFEEDLKPLLQGVTTQDDKIKIIFNYVKSRMTWNNEYGYYCKEGVKNAYTTKVGNVAEINLMLTAMLRFADIDANPVLISTRNNGVSIFPSRTSFNYVIAAVEIENDLILLDATSKIAFQNIIPKRALNWFGRIIRKEGSSKQVELTPKFVSKENVNAIIDLSYEGKLMGKVRNQYTDYLAFSFREKYAKTEENSYLEKLEKNYGNIEINDYKLTNIDDLNNPVSETYTFNANNSVEIIGNKMFFSPLLFFAENVNPFKQEKREYPIDFIFPMEDKYVLTINIPKGYAVESLPKPIVLSMNENIANLKFLITNTDTQIQVSCSMKINWSVVPAEYYEELKAFFGEVIKKENEKIVLKKI